ncbi:MAG: sigma-70 family RNA polymerase sigma factor [Dehalococcoidia bacterium]
MSEAQGVFTCTTHTPLPLQNEGGDWRCFNCLVEEHQAQVYNLCAYLLGDRALAEDATQETLLSAYHALSRFRGGNLRAWLLRIAANTCKDMLRAARARPSLSLEEMTPLEQPLAASGQDSPEESALRRELRQVIRQGLLGLPPEQRMALVLVDVQGLSYEEAAQAMACNLGTVRSRLSRARAAMRDYLRHHGELLPSQVRQDR